MRTGYILISIIGVILIMISLTGVAYFIMYGYVPIGSRNHALDYGSSLASIVAGIVLGVLLIYAGFNPGIREWLDKELARVRP
jgi:hypothetical protein